jgi:Type ISP C-terminal specificity domain
MTYPCRYHHAGQGGVTMPGKGKTVTRPWTSEELAAIGQGAEALGLSAEQALSQLGDGAVDIYLNGVACWRGVPSGVWSYRLGGYQVMKKWLSYREKALLGRDLKTEEVREVTRMARRIAAILLLQPQLDANYLAVTEHTCAWPKDGRR